MSKKKANLANLIQFAERYFTFPNGDSYCGEFIADLDKREIYRNGKGTYFKLNGQNFTGKWVMDVLVGPAEITFRKDCKYEGSLSSAPEYTAGTYTFGDESQFKGDFNKNLKGIAFFDPNSKLWSHEVSDENEITLKYNWVKDDEEQALCGEDEDSISLPICLSDTDTEEEGC